MKHYTVKISKNTLKKLKIYWSNFKNIEDRFYDEVRKLEESMEKDTGIKDVEFFQNDGYYCGIGNGSRTMKLIQREELEK